MLTPLVMQSASAARAAAGWLSGALRRYRARRALAEMLRFDERMLHDIGISRSDVVHCLSSPWADAAVFLEMRCKRAGAPAKAAKEPPQRRAA